MDTAGKGWIEPKEDKPRAKCRKWLLRVWIGIDPRTGKRRIKSRSFYGKYREAQAALHGFVEEVERTKSHDQRRKITFSELADEFLADQKAYGEVAESTIAKNTNWLKGMRRHIGFAEAEKIEPYMIEDAYKALMAGDSPSGKCLSRTSVNCIARITSSVFRFGVDQGYISSNPCESARAPKCDTKEKDALTDDQIMSLTQICPPNDPRHVGVVLAVMAGLRLGECVLPKWSDLKENTLRVRGTKSEASDGLVVLLPQLLEYLEKWRENQGELMSEHGETNDNFHIVADKFGKTCNSQALGRWWRRNRASLGFPDITFHQLRHSFVTMLARHNVHPSVMQSLARHSDPRTTLSIYTHIRKDQQEEAIRRVANELF